MEFNDEQLPNEDSMRKLQQGYTQTISALQNEEITTINTDLSEIAGNIEWQRNGQLLNNLAYRTQNRCMRGFICGLIPLNQSDRDEVNSYYVNDNFRRNPSVFGSMATNFASSLRDYIRAETELLDSLVQLLYNETDSTRRQNIYNIIRRRLDALDTLASFWTTTFFA